MSCTTGVMYVWISTILELSVNSLQLGILRILTALPGKKGPGGGTKRLVCVTMVPPGWQRSILLLTPPTPPPPPLTVLHITVISDRKVSSQLKIPCFFRSYFDSVKLISIANQSLNKKICK